MSIPAQSLADQADVGSCGDASKFGGGLLQEAVVSLAPVVWRQPQMGNQIQHLPARLHSGSSPTINVPKHNVPSVVEELLYVLNRLVVNSTPFHGLCKWKCSKCKCKQGGKLIMDYRR